MISRFFIGRPIFATVLSIIICLVGMVALKSLPIEQYPNITPPQINVSVTYPGASSEMIANTVAAPLEDQINGVEDMIYMYSQNAQIGGMNLQIFFDIGTDIDQALNNVQNLVYQTISQLPDEVQREGITVKKQTPTILLIVSLQTEDDRYSDLFISNYATINVVDVLQRVKGVSQVNIIGARNYAMRIWVRPDLMAQHSLSATDVINAVRDQNADYAVGQFGQQPMSQPIELALPIVAKGRSSDPKDYEDMILKANQDGSTVRIKDIGRVELGAQSYDVNGRLDEKPATLIAIYQEFGANALDVAKDIKQTMEKLSKKFPKGLKYSVPYDTTMFVKASIKDVTETLIIAAILVTIVILVFLQNLRATLIPVIAMIVSILGTFIGMYALGFSLNLLTLFGLILSIGIVVDDAIVVVENVARNMEVHKLTGKDAAIKAMEEVTSPIIAIVFVLIAVFIPVAFLGGIAGQLYKQFAITISISVIFSGFVALTLSPVLAALFLKPTKENIFSRYFNKGLDKFIHFYTYLAAKLIAFWWLALLLFIIVFGILYLTMKITPAGFLPQEDQGYLVGVAILPDAASLERTNKVTKIVEKDTVGIPGIKDIVSMSGYSFTDSLYRTQIGTYFIILDDWSVRNTPELQAEAVLRKLMMKYSQVSQAQIIGFNPPAIQGLGTVGGFEFWLINQANLSVEEFGKVVQDYISKAKERPEIFALNTTFQANGMQLYVDLDRTKTRAYDVSIAQAYQTLQALLGSVYIDNFDYYGRVFQVMIQAEPQYRSTLDNFGQMYVRSQTNQMIPLMSLITTKFSKGPPLVSRFNGFPAAKIMAGPAVGYSAESAIKAMEEVAKDYLPDDVDYSWSGIVYQQQETQGSSAVVLLGGLISVFLILSALYERWSLPFAILLAVPFAILGAFLANYLRGLTNDVYFQIGLVTLIALSAKNSILLVEFAIMRKKEGIETEKAAIEAMKMRLRAILMTSLTFVLGVLPLVTSKGAGAASRHAVGTGVMGGMLVATFIGILFIPLFYKILENLGSKKK